MRRWAEKLRTHGVALRGLAERLTDEARGAHRATHAAEMLEDRAHTHASRLREAAARHDAAADALDAHLQEVEQLRETIAGIERRAHALVSEARARLERSAERGAGMRIVPDPDDEILAAFVPPPPGHRDWLAVELPGL